MRRTLLAIGAAAALAIAALPTSASAQHHFGGHFGHFGFGGPRISFGFGAAPYAYDYDYAYGPAAIVCTAFGRRLAGGCTVCGFAKDPALSLTSENEPSGIARRLVLSRAQATSERTQAGCPRFLKMQ